MICIVQVRVSARGLAHTVMLTAIPFFSARATLTRLGRRTLAGLCLSGSLCAIIPAGCSAVAVPPPYTQDEIKSRCESRGGRWHDGDPMRSFCEYDSHG